MNSSYIDCLPATGVETNLLAIGTMALLAVVAGVIMLIARRRKVNASLMTKALLAGGAILLVPMINPAPASATSDDYCIESVAPAPRPTPTASSSPTTAPESPAPTPEPTVTSEPTAPPEPTPTPTPTPTPPVTPSCEIGTADVTATIDPLVFLSDPWVMTLPSDVAEKFAAGNGTVTEPIEWKATLRYYFHTRLNGNSALDDPNVTEDITVSGTTQFPTSTDLDAGTITLPPEVTSEIRLALSSVAEKKALALSAEQNASTGQSGWTTYFLSVNGANNLAVDFTGSGSYDEGCSMSFIATGLGTVWITYPED